MLPLGCASETVKSRIPQRSMMTHLLLGCSEFISSRRRQLQAAQINPCKFTRQGCFTIRNPILPW